MRLFVRLAPLFALLLAGYSLLATPPRSQAADLVIYADGLTAGWEDYSYNAAIDFAATGQVFSGSNAIQVAYTNDYGALSLRIGPALNPAAYQGLNLRIFSSSAANIAFFIQVSDGGPAVETVTRAIEPGAWREISLSLADLGSPSAIARINIQEQGNRAVGGAALPTIFVDQVVLVGTNTGPTPTNPSGGSGPALAIDANADRAPISDQIYGANQLDTSMSPGSDQAGFNQRNGLTVQRWGGNSTTRYNYLNNTNNTGSDYFYENIPFANTQGQQLPDGSSVNRFLDAGVASGVESLVTVPTIGYVAKDPPANRNHPYDCGFQVSRYGAQQAIDPFDPDCGNGIRPDGSRISGNNPADTSIVIAPRFVGDWVRYLVARYGRADQGGVRYYALDNEPGLWHETHRDIHPANATFQELRDRSIAIAQQIKAADPSAQVLGPVQDGWTRYYYAGLTTFPDAAQEADRIANGGLPFVPWYLAQMRAYEEANGVRLLDYLDLHYYPQAPGVALSPASGSANRALRLRTTRSLWDSTYVDESYIADTEGGPAVRLIPLLREWINTYYPGTKLALTEYNFGALDDLNGALAQADVLGIFGREGVDLATIWAMPDDESPGNFAFRMYRNYDGNGGQFGGTRIGASSADQSQLAVYAAERSDGALTIMVINKTGTAFAPSLTINNFSPANAAQVFRYGGANLNQIVQAADAPISGNQVNATFPAQSISLLIVPRGTPQATPTPNPNLRPENYLPLVR